MADIEKIKYFCVVGDCDPVVRNAINEFFSGWEGFSVYSRKKPLFSLIRDVIDDSIKSYWASVSEVQVLYHYGYDRVFCWNNNRNASGIGTHDSNSSYDSNYLWF